MGRCPGVPFDAGPSHGGQTPSEVICHRTYGSWGGDYAVGKGARGGISFHFLVGRAEGQWCQFVDTGQVAWHAKGDNTGTIGIEVTGTNNDPFTDWQVRAVGHICRWISDVHGIPLVKWGGARVTTFHGFRDHAQVAGSDHGDRWSSDDWARVVAAAGGATEETDDMFSDQDRHALEELRAHVVSIEARLPAAETGYGYLLANGAHHWGFTTPQGRLQRWVARASGWECDVDEPGFEPGQWAVMTTLSDRSPYGRSFEISARLTSGKTGRKVWTPSDGWRSGIDEIG